MTPDVERVLADIDADHGDRRVEFLRHGVLLVLSAPCQLLILAGPEHGRTIADVEQGERPAHNETAKRHVWGDSVMSVAIERGMRLYNAFNKEIFVFSGPVDDPAVARFDVVLEQGGTGGGNALLPIPPYAEEDFSGTSGPTQNVA